MGRAIRHKDDWGALLFLDPRFGNRRSLSKWVAPLVRDHQGWERAVLDLRLFFADMERNPPGAQPPPRQALTLPPVPPAAAAAGAGGGGAAAAAGAGAAAAAASKGVFGGEGGARGENAHNAGPDGAADAMDVPAAPCPPSSAPSSSSAATAAAAPAVPHYPLFRAAAVLLPNAEEKSNSGQTDGPAPHKRKQSRKDQGQGLGSSHAQGAPWR